MSATSGVTNTGRGIRPTVGGVAVTDLSAGAGAVVWLVATVAGALGPVERALALAPLVLVPLGVRMVATPPFEGVAGRLVRWATRLQPVGAGLLVASLVASPDALAAALATPWVAVTGLLGLAALARVRAVGVGAVVRGERLTETVLDAGLAYPTVAAVALVLYHLGVVFWFDPVIVLLTAVHFHYAGFVLPVVAGLAGRCVGSTDRVFRTLAAVVLVGPALIAVGISFSPLVEVLAVGGFTVAVAALGVYVLARVAPARPPGQAVLVGASVLALPVSMALALGYGVGAYAGELPFGLTLGTMVALHGSLNAFGFGLLGLVGWRLDVPLAAETNTEGSAASRPAQ